MNLTSSVSTCIRIMILQATSIWRCLKITAVMLKKKRNLYPWIVFFLLKSVLFTYLFSTVFVVYYYDALWYQMVRLLLFFSLTITWILLLFFSFEGDTLHKMTAGVIADLMATMATILGLLITNLIARRDLLDASNGVIQLTDLLLPVFSSVIFWCIYRFLRPFFIGYRDRVFRFPRIQWVVCGAYFFYGATTYIPSKNTNGTTLLQASLTFTFTSCLLLLLNALGSIFFKARKLRYSNGYIKKILNMAEYEYKHLQLQTKQMELASEQIDKEMEEIGQMDQAELNVHMKEYLSQIKKEYYSVCVGTYSNDWMIDAILCYYAERIQRNHNRIDFLTQEYNGKGIAARDLNQMLMELLEYTQRYQVKNGEVKLHVASVRNQTVLVFSCTGIRKHYPNIKFKQLKKKYNMEVFRKLEGQVMTVEIVVGEE